MKKKQHIKQMVAVLGLSVVVVPSIALVVVGCKGQGTENISKIKETDELVVKAINKISYEISVSINSSVKDLKSKINAEFIKEKLDSENKEEFDDQNFSLISILKVDDQALTDNDLIVERSFATKIIYDYGEIKNQTANLIIAVSRHLLEDVFKDFKFVDSKGVSGFVDVVDLAIISKQVLAWVSSSAKNLDEVGLNLENPSSNSIIVKAKSNSKLYRGQVTLTWNLKLFEIYGIEIGDKVNEWTRKGLRGYFYLENHTKQIKYFDFINYFYPKYKYPIHVNFVDYHKFTFKNENNEEKNFTFKGNEYTINAIKRFGSFNFTKETRVLVDTPEPTRVKIFNSIQNEWSKISDGKVEFLINSLGQITKISK